MKHQRTTVTFISLQLCNSECESILILNFDKDKQSKKKLRYIVTSSKKNVLFWNQKMFLLENYADTIASNLSFPND